MKNQEIELGDKVRCIYTGFEGIAIAKMEFMNGCIQFDVVPRVGKDKRYPDGITIDSKSLEVIKKAKPKIEEDEEEPTGGPNHTSIRMRGF
jgi:hypothetical protein